MTTKLDKSFYLQEDVVRLARLLIGKRLVSRVDGHYCSGLISETEAYAGAEDRASHAFGNRRTARTEIMFREGGHAYIYLCYGIHHLFNVVSNSEGIPHAILIRGMIQEQGIPVMQERRKFPKDPARLCAGPGTLSQAMGFRNTQSGISLLGETVWIEESGIRPGKDSLSVGPRIGVDYAGEDALLPYRFLWNGERD